LAGSTPDVTPSSSKSGIPADFFDAEPKAPVVKTEFKTVRKAEVPRQIKTEKVESAQRMNGLYTFFLNQFN